MHVFHSATASATRVDSPAKNASERSERGHHVVAGEVADTLTDAFRLCMRSAEVNRHTDFQHRRGVR